MPRSPRRGCERVLSIAAGVTLARLEAALGGGVAGRAGHAEHAGAGRRRRGGHRRRARRATDDDLAWAEAILGAVGTVVRVPETLLDAVTGLSGSGPAYVFLVAEALIEAGVLVGLPRDVERGARRSRPCSARPGCSTETGDAPEALRAAVTSPGGTTAAGLRALESAGVRAAFLDAVTAATERSRELGEQPELGAPRLRPIEQHQQQGRTVSPAEEGVFPWRSRTVAGAVPDRAEVADLLRVSTMTVYRLIKAGELRAVRVGKSYRVREDDLDAFLANQYTQAG